MKGKSNTANSLAWLARMPAFMDIISSVPPCKADTLGPSPPSTPPGNRFTLILPPDLAVTSSPNFFMPATMGWPSGFWVANLMVRSLTSCADAIPNAAKATLAMTVLRKKRFMVISWIGYERGNKGWKRAGAGSNQP